MSNQSNGRKGNGQAKASRNTSTSINNNKKSNKNINRDNSRAASIIAAPVSMSRGQTTGVANIQRNVDGSIRVRHREFVVNVVGSTAFTVSSGIPIQPGSSYTFSWLNNVARQFEQYEFQDVQFVCYPRCSTTTPGSVLLSPDYDSADSPLSNEQQFTAQRGTVEDSCWKELRLKLDKNRLKGRRFIRTGVVPSGQDIKTFDVANVHLATVDFASAVASSKMWVEYDVILFDPSNTNAAAHYGVYRNDGSGGGPLFGASGAVSGDIVMAPVAMTNILNVTGLLPNATYIMTYGFAGTGLTYAPGVSASSGSFNITQFASMAPNNTTQAGGWFKFINGASTAVTFTWGATSYTTVSLSVITMMSVPSPVF